jgi:tetratricopeptide (TPR) repeat protein
VAALAAALMVVLGVSLPLLVGLWRRAEGLRADALQQRDQARQQSAIANAVNDFLNHDVLRQASARGQAGQGRTPHRDLKVRDALDRAAASIPSRFTGQPRVEVAIRLTIGGAYRELGEYDKARARLEAARELARESWGDEDPQTLWAMHDLAVLYQAQGQYARAEPLYLRTLEVQRRVLGAEHPDTLTAQNNLAVLYSYQGLYAQAEPLWVMLLEVQRRQFGPGHRQVADTLAALGLSRLRLQKHAEAGPLLRECLTIRAREQPDAWPTFNTRSLLGGSLLGQGKYAEAEPLLVAGYEGMKAREAQIPAPSKVRLTEALERLVQLYDAWGRKGEADGWRKKLKR